VEETKKKGEGKNVLVEAFNLRWREIVKVEGKSIGGGI
jgi:hypothetical protein